MTWHDFPAAARFRFETLRSPEIGEAICESCTSLATDRTCQPVLLRQRDHATAHNETGRAELFTKLLVEIGPDR